METLFNLQGAVSKIREFSFKRVILQFPDDLIEYSADVYHYMDEKLNNNNDNSNSSSSSSNDCSSVDLYISADSTYGSSSDDVSAMHVDGDLLVYFGSDLSASSVIPVLLLPRIRSFDCIRCEKAVVPCIEKYIDSVSNSNSSNSSSSSNDSSSSSSSGGGSSIKSAVSVVILYDPSYLGSSLDRLHEALAARYGAAACVLARLPVVADIPPWTPALTKRRHVDANIAVLSNDSAGGNESGCCRVSSLDKGSDTGSCDCSSNNSNSNFNSSSNSNDISSSNISNNCSCLTIMNNEGISINNNSSFSANESSHTPSSDDFVLGGLIVDRRSIKICTEIQSDEVGSIIVYIGNKVEQLNSICLRLSGNTIVHYAPFSSDQDNSSAHSEERCNEPVAIVNTIVGSQSRLFRERYGGIAKVASATVVGLIIGSMGMSSIVTNSVVTRLRILVEASKRQCIVLTMGRINESKLSNFPEIDIFCLITNDDVAYIPPKTFHIPVITPWELELGLGARDWDSSYRVDATCLLGNGVDDLRTAIENVIKNNPENPIDDDDDDDDDDNDNELGGNNAGNSNISSSSGSSASSVVQTAITVKSSSTLALTGAAIPSVERFLQREYKGLDPRVESSSNNLNIQMGMYGTSLGYSYGRKDLSIDDDDDDDIVKDGNGSSAATATSTIAPEEETNV